MSPDEAPIQPSLSIEQSPLFQRREWRIRSVSSVLFAAVLVAAGLGVFGGGPLASARARADGLTVDYERFARHGRASTLTVRVEASASERLTIAIENGYFSDARFESIFPRPMETVDTGDTQRFTFASSPGAPVVIRFAYLPPPPGRHEGRVRVDDASVDVWSFVYP